VNTDRVASFTAASAFPLKVIQNRACRNGVGRIIPVHVQFNPTNACNLNCSFCSCSNRKKTEKMRLEEFQGMIRMFAGLGTKALTITGGGEPMLHPNINEIIRASVECGVQVGLVTNGVFAGNLSMARMKFPPKWIRVSVSDDRDVDGLFKSLLPVISTIGSDWAFSYVLTRAPDYDKLRAIVKFAEDHGFCHVRVVADLFDIGAVPNMEVVRSELSFSSGEALVIYQGRKEFVLGRASCLISLLKPVIGPDGGVWPCCGVQYALNDPSRDLETSMRMGDWRDFPLIMEEQFAFDGSRCVRCYYDEYNRVLGMLTVPLEHREFV